MKSSELRIAVRLVVCLTMAVVLSSVALAYWELYRQGAAGAGFNLRRVQEVWLGYLPFLLAEILLVSAVAFFAMYVEVFLPVRRTAEWVRKVRLLEAFPPATPQEEALLEPLRKETSQLAKSLVAARSEAAHEAQLRHRSESVWTPQRLKEFVKLKLDGRPLCVVSNREPYRHVKKGNAVECVVPASGLVSALEPVLEACGGTWVAHGDGDADRQTVDANDRLRVPADEPQYVLRRVWLNAGEEEGYYYGFANEGLWPLCHIAHTRPIFREKDWYCYEAVNEKFLQAVLEELEGTVEPCLLVQDYHFALLPALLKARRPDARIGLFWHIPWPNPESFGICPWQKELLKGMLGADVIGFHTQFHCNNFLETVDRALESRIDYERFSVHRERHTTCVKSFPIGIAFSENSGPGGTERAISAGREDFLKAHGLSAPYIGIGVDRLDYTKGILERFLAVELFLEKNPSYQGRFTFVQLAAPSRTLIPKYRQLEQEIEKEAGRINARFAGKGDQAILLLKKHHSHEEIQPFYQSADVCLVTSLHDGMNLVAKEYVRSRRDERGVLILSQFTGAARELREALVVNPYDTVQTAEAIRHALEMPEEEKIARMREMQRTLKERNVYRWAADLVAELSHVHLEDRQNYGMPAPQTAACQAPHKNSAGLDPCFF